MDQKTQIIIIIAALVGILFICVKIHQKRIEIKYALPWFVVAIAILILAAFPKMIEALSKAMGIAMPVNMLFFCGLCLSLILLFKLTSAVSRLSNKVKRLTQEIAIIERQMTHTKEGEYDETEHR